ncbi:MAG: hypothetical protein V7L27_06795 [Nostoc sp.]|uniref:hypothetical protein n=1 Tax=Nostoc sp. TaxID=1180 RepID=UPI002FF9A9E6
MNKKILSPRGKGAGGRVRTPYLTIQNLKFKIKEISDGDLARNAVLGCIPSGVISQDKPRLKWVLHVDCRFLNPLIYDKFIGSETQMAGEMSEFFSPAPCPLPLW